MTEQERIHALEVFKDMVENPLVYTECKESDLLTAIEALEQAKPTVKMRKYECLVKRDRITEKIIRWFTSDESAFAWLELEGYRVFYIKELGN